MFICRYIIFDSFVFHSCSKFALKNFTHGYRESFYLNQKGGWVIPTLNVTSANKLSTRKIK